MRPLESEKARACAGQRGRAGHAKRGERPRGGPHPTQGLDGSVETAVKKNEDESGGADAKRKLIIVEGDAADAVAPREHSDAEEDQRDGDARALEHA